MLSFQETKKFSDTQLIIKDRQNLVFNKMTIALNGVTFDLPTNGFRVFVLKYPLVLPEINFNNFTFCTEVFYTDRDNVPLKNALFNEWFFEKFINGGQFSLYDIPLGEIRDICSSLVGVPSADYALWLIDIFEKCRGAAEIGLRKLDEKSEGYWPPNLYKDFVSVSKMFKESSDEASAFLNVRIENNRSSVSAT